ncbi:MAG: FHA domain-containing protein [Phycisphaerales bacterium]|nr:FHA domain-containing protein [Phycisphaerales bacterium]
MAIDTVMMEMHIVNKATGATLRAFALGDATEVIVGRDSDCDVQINAPSVSREHCVIEHVDGDYRLRDLDSTGGTWSNGDRVDDIRVEDGLEVSVGPALLRFVDGD